MAHAAEATTLLASPHLRAVRRPERLAWRQRRIVEIADVVAVVASSGWQGPVKQLVAVEPVNQRMAIRAIRGHGRTAVQRARVEQQRIARFQIPRDNVPRRWVSCTVGFNVGQ